MNLVFFLTSILLTSFFVLFIYCILQLYPLNINASQIICSMCVCQFYSFLLLIAFSESLRFGRFEPRFFFAVWLCVGAVFSSHLFLYEIVDNFWSSNHDFKAVKKNTLKSMANHFVWILFYFCAWTFIPQSRFPSSHSALFLLL